MSNVHQEISMQRRHHVPACTLLGLALLALSGSARAQRSALPATPDATQLLAAEHASRLAEERFAEGTTLFKQWRFDEAEQEFREALSHQDHPLIHLYLSRALEKQGRLVEAHEALQQALRPGAEPLPPEDVQVAADLRQSLESRLAQLEVHCDVPGAQIFVDGEPWFTTPGRPRRVIGAGQHVLMARKPGYFPIAEPVSLFPGMRTRVVLRMTADVVHIERRWKPWQPRTVASAGLAMSLAGGLFLWLARTEYVASRRALDECWFEAACREFPTWRSHRAERRERIGTGALIVGGSALVAGLAGMLINLPRSRRREPAPGLESLHIAPMVSGDTAGISVHLRF